MNYFKLQDNEHRDMIVKADGRNHSIYYEGKWQPTGILLDYFNESSELYDKYTEITESEALKLVG